MSKISIIVPVYNVEKYLEKCIETLINQTLKEIEIILINDGSTDNSVSICDKFAAKDSRIKVIHQENTGVSQARNNAIEKANGEFIMFVDSDDWIEKDTCEIAYNMVIKNNADSLMFDYISESSKGPKNKDIFEKNELIFEGKDVIDKLVKSFIGLTDEETKKPEKIDSTISVWAKLYKLDIIKQNNIKFIDYKIVPSECQLFNIEYFSKAKKVIYIKEHLYHYRRNTGTSITKRYREDLTGKWLYWIDYMKEYIDKELKGNRKIEEAYYNRICFTVIPLSGNSLKHEKYVETYKDMKEILNNSKYKEAYKKLDFTYFPIHWKIYFYLAKKRLTLLFCILSKIMRIIIEKRKS